MRKHYDIVHLTNTPSFYKINLCNEIAKHCSMLVVFTGIRSKTVNMEIDRNNCRFDFHFLNAGESDTRNKISTLLRLLKLMRSINYDKIIYAGWLAPEYNLFSFFCPRRKNVVLCESSILEVKTDGLKGWVKRRIIGRMSAALPSGKPHSELFDSLGFKGPKYITGSVGIFCKNGYRPEPDKNKSSHPEKKFICVARLADVKNLELLIEVFNANGKPLTIVGKGPFENRLKAIAAPNISFMGFIDNDKIGEVYRQHDIFILPSKYEPWGLVVEEAIYWGLPVIVSDHVGSAFDMVETLNTGEIFKHDSRSSLQNAIEMVENNYAKYLEAVNNVDFDARNEAQINAYLKSCNIKS